MSGTVYLVGAGPGAADLLTVRAAGLLERADIVLHDALVEDEVLALAKRARKLNVGKRANRPSADQAFINRLLVRAARSYQTVVRLKGGDPMLFGRAQEEIDACRAAGVRIEIVPGVSAAFAAAAELQASLTQRGCARSVAFVTPAIGRNESADGQWADAAIAAESVAIYMGVGQARRVREALMARGMAGAIPVILAENAGRPGARRLGGALHALESLAAQAGDGPALLLIGAAFANAEVQNTDAALRVRA